MTHVPSPSAIAAGILLVLNCAAGCKFKPPHNLEEQPSAHPPYKPTPVFENQSTARPVPMGTIAREPADAGPAQYADLRGALPLDTSSAGDAQAIPFPITLEVLRRGQQRFDIYCAVCHGRLGDGAGMIVQRGLTPPPSFHIDRLRRVSDGHLYNVISNGYGQMFSYNDRVKPEDRWMIVAYVRALQASTADPAAIARLTDSQRHKLEGVRP